MGKVVTMKGPVVITNLRNGFVRIEAAKLLEGRPDSRALSAALRGRPRLHIRADEFMRLINSATTNFGAL